MDKRREIAGAVGERLKRYILGKTSCLFTLFYANKKEEVEKELSAVRILLNAKAYFRTTPRNLLEGRKPESIAFKFSFPFGVETKEGTVYPVVEGIAVLDTNGKYKIESVSFPITIEDKKKKEVEMLVLDVNDFSPKVREVLSIFLNVILCSKFEELQKVIPKW